MTRKSEPASIELDCSAALAKPVKVGQFTAVDLWLVGCGGTGSWLAPAVARTARQLRERDIATRLVFVDPDRVEEGNIYRQNFCDAEIGQLKAETLARRYSEAWGLEIHIRAEYYAPEMLVHSSPFSYHDRAITVLLGCVDRASGRQAMAKTLTGWPDYYQRDEEKIPDRLWWLDCGNALASGQVLLGSTFKVQRLRAAFPLPDRCGALPAPALQQPDLLQPRADEDADHKLSCAQMAQRNAQSLTVNQMVAAVAADYLMGLLLTQDVRCFASYFDLATKSLRSRYITPETLARWTNEKKRARKKK